MIQKLENIAFAIILITVMGSVSIASATYISNEFGYKTYVVTFEFVGRNGITYPGDTYFNLKPFEKLDTNAAHILIEQDIKMKVGITGIYRID